MLGTSAAAFPPPAPAEFAVGLAGASARCPRVAQTSKSAVSRGPNPQTARHPATPRFAAHSRNSTAPADLEIGDTAGLETGATTVRGIRRRSRGRISVYCNTRPNSCGPGGTLENSPALQCWVSGGGRTKSRQGRPTPLADASAVPAGLAGGIAAYPALKCWAILGRPSGTAKTVPRRCKKLRCAPTLTSTYENPSKPHPFR